jgi:hypothetical protein
MGCEMRKPVTKKMSKITPNFLARYIVTGLRTTYEEKLYDDCRHCPKCRYKDYIRSNKVRKIFCRVIEDRGITDIYVYLKQYRCRECGPIYTTKGPYYPGTEYGKPIVNLVLYLASTNPYNRVEKILMEFGIQVDRDTVKRYVKLFKMRTLRTAGIAGENIRVNVIRLLFDKPTVERMKGTYPDERFDAVADEVYPARKGAKKRLRRENRERKRKGKNLRNFLSRLHWLLPISPD